MRRMREKVTAEDFYRDVRYEDFDLVGGAMMVREPPGGAHGMLAARLAAALEVYLESNPLGTAFVEAGFVTRRNPDTVRAPDVAFVRGARRRLAEIPSGFLPVGPDLAAEIVSPSNTGRLIEVKVGEYFGAGAAVVWVLDPSVGVVTVHRPAAPATTLGAADALTEETLLPGFRLEVARLFR